MKTQGEIPFGRRPLIYTTAEFHDAHLKGKLQGERFWIRSLILPPRFRSDSWLVWQYHNRGRRSGIIGPVDLNIARSALFDEPTTRKNTAATRGRTNMPP